MIDIMSSNLCHKVLFVLFLNDEYFMTHSVYMIDTMNDDLCHGVVFVLLLNHEHFVTHTVFTWLFPGDGVIYHSVVFVLSVNDGPSLTDGASCVGFCSHIKEKHCCRLQPFIIVMGLLRIHNTAQRSHLYLFGWLAGRLVGWLAGWWAGWTNSRFDCSIYSCFG